MKVMSLVILLLFSGSTLAAENETLDHAKVVDLTVADLRSLIREIIRETLEECVVKGTMEGRTTITLKVFGDLTAKILCRTTEK